jgi:asparagine synthase (glutamine-hydrolysing)
MESTHLDGRPTGWPEWLETTDHIGSHYPFYELPCPDKVSLHIGDIVAEIPPSERELDLAGVVQMVSRHRLLGNRTLLSGVRRSPWLAEPTGDSWVTHDVPYHDTARRSVDDVVDDLHERLRTELAGYLGPDDDVGLLLSGGLDSRVLAGVLREHEQEATLGSIQAFTWGIEDCRDVVYARSVAEAYGWQFERLPLGPELLLENVRTTGLMGAEFAPYHLHALPRLRERDDVNVYLAGSYGNSIGRAEYAGDHVTELGPIVPSRLNKYGVLPRRLVADHRETVLGDGYGYRDRVYREAPYQYYELEQQLHYMRRGLQSCMTHVAEVVPLHQLFTAPDVVELMWGLAPSSRGTNHYKTLLRQLPGDLLAIPDAKKGLVGEGGTAERHEELAARPHRYGTWLREDLHDDIVDCIRDGPVARLCNERTLSSLLRIWPRASTTTMNRVDDLVSWLASLSIFLAEYDVSVPETQPSLLDELNAVTGPVHAATYQTARGFFRQ